MQPVIKELNNAILNCFNDNATMNKVASIIIKNRSEILPYDRYGWHLAEVIIVLENIRKKTEALINVEQPTRYMLFDCLTRYIEVDSRAEAIRERLNEFVRQIN